MEIIRGYQPYNEDEIKQLVSTSSPIKTNNFKLKEAKEEYGWVNFYFKQENKSFKVTLTLADGDLKEIVMFFENIICLKDDIAVFLNDELISEPLLYASPIDENNIRLLIADGKTVHDKWKQEEIEDEDIQLSQYEIRCDVIINKKQLLKEFYTSIKNIINNFENNEIYTIGYNNWKDYLKHIILFCQN